MGGEGEGERQRGTTWAGANDDNVPPPPGVGGSNGQRLILTRKYRSRLGGKEAVDDCGGYTKIAFCPLFWGVNILVLVVSSSSSSSLSSSSSSSLSNGAGYQQICQRGWSRGYRELAMMTDVGRSRDQVRGC